MVTEGVLGSWRAVGVWVPDLSGVLGAGVRPVGVVWGAVWCGVRLFVLPGVRLSVVLGVRLSGVPGVRPSAPGVRVCVEGVEVDGVLGVFGVLGEVRRVLAGVDCGVEAGPAAAVLWAPGVRAGPEADVLGPVAVVFPGTEPVAGAAAEGVRAGPVWVVGLVGPVVEEAPGVCVAGRAPAVPPPVVVGAVGEVGMAEPLSGRPPPPPGAGSVAGVGAAALWMGTLAARLSMLVLMPPLPDEAEAVPPDEVGAGAECGVGEERPETEEPPPVWEVPEDPVVVPVSGALVVAATGVGSSKSDRVGPVDEGAGLG